ncbi:MAG: signal peptide peptidase SppA [candidate division KSB1 bacterium]|nr:signal peptide peptidase SppA [candidate division KSB1 bacterium]
MARKQDIRILAFLGGLLVLAAVLFTVLLRGRDLEVVAGEGSERVALVELRGVIVNSEPIVRQLERFRKDRRVRAIVLRVDSPGGGVAASQEIYEAVRRVREGGKPIVCSMGSVAASGGYYVALGCKKIVANPGTTTGSIGVIAEIPNVQRLLSRLGIEVSVVKSGRHKDIGSPYREMTDDERRLLQEWIDDAYHQFVTVVATERSLDSTRLRELADGRVFTGRQAYQLGLVDTLGTLGDAIRLAADLAGIRGEPRVVRIPTRRLGCLELLLGGARSLQELAEPWPRLKYQWSGY